MLIHEPQCLFKSWTTVPVLRPTLKGRAESSRKQRVNHSMRHIEDVLHHATHLFLCSRWAYFPPLHLVLQLFLLFLKEVGVVDRRRPGVFGWPMRVNRAAD